MSGNPNMQKIGKRRAPAGGAPQAKWLFPEPGGNTAAPTATTATTTSNVPAPSKRSLKRQEKKLAEDLLKRRDAGEPAKSAPPAELVGLVGAFLADHQFTNTSKAFTAESQTGLKPSSSLSLDTIYKEWVQFKGEKAANKTTMAKNLKDASSSTSSSGTSSDNDVEMADVVCSPRLMLLITPNRSNILRHN